MKTRVQRLARWWAALVLALLLGCSVPVVKPGWQNSSGAELRELAVTGSAGGRVTSQVMFVPADDESAGLAVRIGGEEASWLSVEPERIPSVEAGVAVPLSITVRIPAGTPPGDYEGSVSLLTGTKTVARLPVKIAVQ